VLTSRRYRQHQVFSGTAAAPVGATPGTESAFHGSIITRGRNPSTAKHSSASRGRERAAAGAGGRRADYRRQAWSAGRSVLLARFRHVLALGSQEIEDAVMRGSSSSSLVRPLVCRECHCCHHGVFGPARIETRGLDDDWHVRLHDRRVGYASRYGLWIVQLIQTQVIGAARRNGEIVRACRLPIGEVDGYTDVGFLVGRVENRCRLMALPLRLRPVAPPGDHCFRNGPHLPADLPLRCSFS
jgi:hypothetical protein